MKKGNGTAPDGMDSRKDVDNVGRDEEFRIKDGADRLNDTTWG